MLEFNTQGAATLRALRNI